MSSPHSKVELEEVAPSPQSAAASNVRLVTSDSNSVNKPVDAGKRSSDSGASSGQKGVRSPFGFAPETLQDLVDPKSVESLNDLGGVEGIATGLKVNVTRGLDTDVNDPKSVDESEARRVLEEADRRSTDLYASSLQKKGVNCPPDALEFVHVPEIGRGGIDRVKYFGKNVLPEVKSKTLMQLVWDALQDKVLILLMVAAAVSLVIGIVEDRIHAAEVANKPHGDESEGDAPAYVEGLAILVAVALVTGVSAGNDFQKERQFRKLNAKKEDREVKVLRGGESTFIPIFNLLVGDVLYLEPGDILPADGVLLSSSKLACDESGATGESDAVKKSPDGEDPFLLSGSRVLEGCGLCVVIAVGERSFHGKTMMGLRQEAQTTPLQEKLNDLANDIATFGSLAGSLMFVVLMIRFFVRLGSGGYAGGSDIVQAVVKILISSVTVVVVAVPEGLPLAVTLSLAFATIRMLKDNNLVRVLASCETMGNATTVCSDKTGTLTQNKMTVVELSAGVQTEVHLDDVSKGDGVAQNNSELRSLFVDAVASNSSAFRADGEFVGNKTECALLAFGQAVLDCRAPQQETETSKSSLNKSDIMDVRTSLPVEYVCPFSSERKAMATITRTNKLRMQIKGASEIILGKCAKVVTSSGEVVEMTDKTRTLYEDRIREYATKSLRTIGIAYRDLSEEEYTAELHEQIIEPSATAEGSQLVFIGVVGIMDPLRPGVPEAVATCKRVGVTIRMVTGDNRITARAIAESCGILEDGAPEEAVMEGVEFRNLSDSERERIAPILRVLARSSPDDKRVLVSLLQKRGDVVAVTGDGTNDGPALKQADVGFSMGIAGTEVAKEASSIVLMDDNFTSIVKAIGWGRCVNDSVRKFLQFQLTVNVTAVISAFVSAATSPDLEPVLTAVQLLWVNLIMDTLAALALATDPPTADLLLRKPDRRTAKLISRNMWKHILGQAAFQLVIISILVYAPNAIMGTLFGYEDPKLDDYVREAGRCVETEKESGNPVANYDACVADSLKHKNYEQVRGSLVFNVFVWMQIVNQYNCRVLGDRLNIFKGLFNNWLFIAISLTVVILQVIIVEFGGAALGTTGDLTFEMWLFSIAIGLISLPVAVLLKFIKVSEPAVIEFQDTGKTKKSKLDFFKRIRKGPKSNKCIETALLGSAVAATLTTPSVNPSYPAKKGGKVGSA